MRSSRIMTQALHLCIAFLVSCVLAACYHSNTETASFPTLVPTGTIGPNQSIYGPTSTATQTAEIEHDINNTASTVTDTNSISNTDRSNELVNEFFASQFKHESGITDAQLRKYRVDQLLITIEQLLKEQSNQELAILLLLKTVPLIDVDDTQAIEKATKILQNVASRQSSVALDLAISAPCAGFACSGASSATVNADSSLIVTVSDLAVKVIDFYTGEEITQLGFHVNGVNDAAFSPDSTRVATVGGVTSTGYRDKPLKIWDLSVTNPGLSPLYGYSSDAPGYCVDYSDTGEFLVYGDGDGFLHVLSADGGEILLKIDAHTQGINDVAFSHNSQYVASASDDGTAKLWSMNSNAPILSFVEHTSQVSSVDFSPDDSHLATGSADGTLKIWNLTLETAVTTLEVGSPVLDLAYFPDGSKIVVASNDGKVGVWNTSKGNLIIEFDVPEVSGVEIASNGEKIVTSDWNKMVRVWDIKLEPVNPLGFDDLLADVAKQVTRDLSSAECLEYMKDPECNIRSRFLERDEITIQGELALNQPVFAQLAAGERHAWVYKATSTTFEVTLQSENAVLLEIYDPVLGLIYISDDWILDQLQIKNMESQEFENYMMVVSASPTSVGSYMLEVSAGDRAE